MSNATHPENEVEDELSGPLELPDDIKDWSKEDVKQWILKLPDVDRQYAKILYDQDINGSSFLLLDTPDLFKLGVKYGPAKLIIHKRDKLKELKAQQLGSRESQSSRPCKPYPFNRFHDAYRYNADGILDVPESGPLNYIEPCHEFKAYTNLGDITAEEKMTKFTDEVIRFAAACMNCRTNGTIHFGVGDIPGYIQGKILGVRVQDKEAYVKGLPLAIQDHFEHKHTETAKKCIGTPRFVEVLNLDGTSSEKYVIEVDIEPSFVICKDSYFHINTNHSKKAKKKAKGRGGKTENVESSKSFYIRDSSSTRNLLASKTQRRLLEEYDRFINNMTELSQRRKAAEEKHLARVKNSVQGSKLCEMLTGGSHSLDKSNFERYLMVTNKSHPVQLDSLAFLLDMNLTAVLDFDPESEANGLKKYFDNRKTNVHLPSQYKITEAVEDIANKLKLTRTTSWVFCNGVVGRDPPSDIDDWLMEKGSSVHDVISFMGRKDVLPHKKFLVIFLLLSDVNHNCDPLLGTFGHFIEELKGIEQILCICENERSYTYWKDLIWARYGVDISKRCIFDLSFAEVNGTVLSLWSDNRKSSRFLPCPAGSKVLLSKKDEDSLDALSILCVNQCEGGNEDKIQLEEKFYKGEKVTWWNFYFSEQLGSTPFIKRDRFDYIISTVIPDMPSFRRACVLVNIVHVPGCGGTTVAMHILWTLKEQFRCAVLKNREADVTEVAQQVVKLLTYKTEQPDHLPVLLMIDDFEDMTAVYDLQHHIEKECSRTYTGSKHPDVVILNCMRGEEQGMETIDNTVFIANKLSENEQKLFQRKLEDIEKIHKNADTFYGFMIMKTNFSLQYVRDIAKNTLKSFKLEKKQAQLIAVMVLLDVYNKQAKLSVSLCEEFLELQPKPNSDSCRVEDGLGKFSTLVTQCTVESKVIFEGLRMIHSSIAEYCLEELTNTHNVSKAEITNLLLTTDTFYEGHQGKDKLMQELHSMLVRRHHSSDFQFSPLITAISNETPGSEETVLLNASKRFEKDAVIAQHVSRHYYLKKKDFREAKIWAAKAKELQRDSSYISDTSGQVIKHELKNATANDKSEHISADKLKEYLEMAGLATAAFRETQDIARREAVKRFQDKKDHNPYNTAGCLGEIQVAVIVIEILEKIPVFSLSKFHRRNLCQILSEKQTIQEAAKRDKAHGRETRECYYSVLKEFETFLYSRKHNMKRHFDFLDRFYVNLTPFFSLKNTRQDRFQQELFKCFQKYADLFWKNDSHELKRNQTLHRMLAVEGVRQNLEMLRADSHSGLLQYLSNKDPAANVEKIVSLYHFILEDCRASLKDTVNFIYANVVLSCVKPQSQLLVPHNNLVHILLKTLERPIPNNDSVALHFISVVLLWPQQSPFFVPCTKIGSYVSQLRTSFSNEMRSLWNGKRPVTHFYLCDRTGYDRLICQYDLSNYCPEQNVHLRGQNLLCRVTGEVANRKMILADTPIPNFKIEVHPESKTHLSGLVNKRVSFFIGFSMNGPLAFGIDQVN